MRVLLADDHEIVRVGLRALLEEGAGYEVVADVGTADQAVMEALAHKPDLVVMDIQLPGRSGLEATAAITKALPDTRVVILTGQLDEGLVDAASAAGAVGFLTKKARPAALLDGLAAATSSESGEGVGRWRTARELMRSSVRQERGGELSGLSPLQLSILGCLADGLTNQEIADRLCLSRKTVRNYASEIFGRIGVRTRAAAAAYAIEHGLKKQWAAG
ncbi:MAG: response regulator transcription factor [Chloroflexota bacterium]